MRRRTGASAGFVTRESVWQDHSDRAVVPRAGRRSPSRDRFATWTPAASAELIPHPAAGQWKGVE